jgi:peptidoglycan/xylan/chitin deacetylase (PgdA/CDA1 family)
MPDLLNGSFQRYGAEVGLPRLIDLLERLRLPATGVMSGLAVQTHPELVQRFAHGAVQREVCPHSWTQDQKVYDMSRDEFRADVERCTEIITKVTGHRPCGWISPSGLFAPYTPEVLVELGYRYHGDWAHTDSYTIATLPTGRLVQMSIPWEVNDTSQYARNYHAPGGYFELFKRSFDVLYREGGGVLGAVAQATTFARPFGVSALEEVIEYARSHEDVWFTTREAIADWALQPDDNLSIEDR